MKIGIFGGTFDPIHCGHLELARNARTQFSLDKVIFIPAYLSPHKQGLPELTPAQDRYEMVRLAVEGDPSFELSDCELKRKGISYTVDTLAELESRHPGGEFFLILGRDAFAEIDTWRRVGELKNKVRFLVADRGDCGTRVPSGARAEGIRMPLCPVSASAIRKAVRQGKDVAGHVPPKVLEYIRARALYRGANA